jgi:hypothetical protein
MFAKIFDQMFTGSMMGAGAPVFAVWTYVLANCNRKGEVELNPKLMAVLLGMQEQEVAAVIEQLCSPDPASRTPDHEGRRLLKQGRYSYFAPNYAKYREIRCEEERREALRLYQRAHREKKKATAVDVSDVNNVNIGQAMSGESSNAEALDASTSTSTSTSSSVVSGSGSSGERRERERGEAKHKRITPDYSSDPRFCELWETYRKDSCKKQAWEQWRKLEPNDSLFVEILDGARHLVKAKESQFRPDLFRWLRDARWSERPPIDGLLQSKVRSQPQQKHSYSYDDDSPEERDTRYGESGPI